MQYADVPRLAGLTCMYFDNYEDTKEDIVNELRRQKGSKSALQEYMAEVVVPFIEDVDLDDDNAEYLVDHFVKTSLTESFLVLVLSNETRTRLFGRPEAKKDPLLFTDTSLNETREFYICNVSKYPSIPDEYRDIASAKLIYCREIPSRWIVLCFAKETPDDQAQCLWNSLLSMARRGNAKELRYAFHELENKWQEDIATMVHGVFLASASPANSGKEPGTERVEAGDNAECIAASANLISSAEGSSNSPSTSNTAGGIFPNANASGGDGRSNLRTLREQLIIAKRQIMEHQKQMMASQQQISGYHPSHGHGMVHPSMHHPHHTPQGHHVMHNASHSHSHHGHGNVHNHLHSHHPNYNSNAYNSSFGSGTAASNAGASATGSSGAYLGHGNLHSTSHSGYTSGGSGGGHHHHHASHHHGGHHGHLSHGADLLGGGNLPIMNTRSILAAQIPGNLAIVANNVISRNNNDLSVEDPSCLMVLPVSFNAMLTACGVRSTWETVRVRYKNYIENIQMHYQKTSAASANATSANKEGEGENVNNEKLVLGGDKEETGAPLTLSSFSGIHQARNQEDNSERTDNKAEKKPPLEYPPMLSDNVVLPLLEVFALRNDEGSSPKLDEEDMDISNFPQPPSPLIDFAASANHHVASLLYNNPGSSSLILRPSPGSASNVMDIVGRIPPAHLLSNANPMMHGFDPFAPSAGSGYRHGPMGSGGNAGASGGSAAAATSTWGAIPSLPPHMIPSPTHNTSGGNTASGMRAAGVNSGASNGQGATSWGAVSHGDENNGAGAGNGSGGGMLEDSFLMYSAGSSGNAGAGNEASSSGNSSANAGASVGGANPMMYGSNSMFTMENSFPSAGYTSSGSGGVQGGTNQMMRPTTVLPPPFPRMV